MIMTSISDEFWKFRFLDDLENIDLKPKYKIQFFKLNKTKPPYKKYLESIG